MRMSMSSGGQKKDDSIIDAAANALASFADAAQASNGKMLVGKKSGAWKGLERILPLLSRQRFGAKQRNAHRLCSTLRSVSASASASEKTYIMHKLADLDEPVAAMVAGVQRAASDRDGDALRHGVCMR